MSINNRNIVYGVYPHHKAKCHISQIESDHDTKAAIENRLPRP